MIKKRPVNLDLTSLHYPPMAIVSILHRISGVVLFLLSPLMLYYLQLSLDSANSFNALKANNISKLFLFVFVCAFLFHLLAGIRHLVMDFGYGESLRSGRVTAWMIIGIFLVLLPLAGVMVW